MSENWSDWVGRRETREDVITPAALARYKAALDMADADAAIVPDGFHWCVCLPDTPTQALGADGHPPLGGFMPPVGLPRRMWAASDVRFLAPLTPNMAIARHSEILSITPKEGQSGKLVFVELNHLTEGDGKACIEERQTIVYRDHPTAAIPLPAAVGFDAAEDWGFQSDVTPDAPLLFRYSALMFNTHRIHYDTAYAREAELYPDLVVHGPLTASLLLKLCGDRFGPNGLAQFSFRAQAPLFVNQPIYLRGRQDDKALHLTAFGGDGRVAIQASAVLA